MTGPQRPESRKDCVYRGCVQRDGHEGEHHVTAQTLEAIEHDGYERGYRARAAERTETGLREENARLRELLALRHHGSTGPLGARIPWFIHCGISHGADRPDCVVCRALAADPRKVSDV